MINIKQINAKQIDDIKSEILDSISSDNMLIALSDWVIREIPWESSATSEKLQFMQSGPLIFGGGEAFTVAQGLVGRSADCVGQANTFAFLAEGLNLDVELSGYATNRGTSHRIAIIDANSDSPKVFDPSLCQSYIDKHGELPIDVRFIDMQEYIEKSSIDIDKTISQNRIANNKFVSSKLDVKLMMLAYSDISAHYMSESLTELSESNMTLQS